jgi:uncharacterized surface protein with fasciclin (FAS1) repeats
MKTPFRKSILGLTMLGLVGASLAISAPAHAQNSTGIRGVAFVDSNANGKRDAGEGPYFARYKVTNGGSFWVCGNTNGSGQFTVGLSSPGTFFVMPISGPGYHTTAPVIKVDVKQGALTEVELPFAPSALAAADQCGAYAPKRTARVPLGIPETAVAGGFNTLTAAINQAGLFDTLSGPGPFTVFAPTDLAFAKFTEEELAAVLADKALLTSILTYHVVPGRVSANDVVNATSLKTVNGKDLPVEVKDGEVFVGGARVIATDVAAANGIVHAIDTVMVP